MNSGEEIDQNVQNADPGKQDTVPNTENQVIRSILEDWDDLSKDFTQLQIDHELYKKKLEEMISLQKKCLSGIAHQRYRLKKMADASKEAGTLSAEDSAIMKDLSAKTQKRKDKFRDLEDVLPHKNGIYLSIILGQVNISLLNKEDKYTYKHEYERFKLTVSSIILGISLFLIVASYVTTQRWMDATLHFLSVWYYCTLTIRENILIVNGSRIKGWWVYHHFISTVCAGITLIWPDGWTYMNFRTQYGIYSLYLACVQVLQYYYQKGSLYRLKALGERHDMDITVEGFMSWMFKGLAFLLPFLFIGYIFQFYNAYVLYQLALHPRCKEWQVRH